MASNSSSKSLHPCHNLSEPLKSMYWCRHCMKRFTHPMDRWRHSKTCREDDGTMNTMKISTGAIGQHGVKQLIHIDSVRVLPPTNPITNTPKKSTLFGEPIPKSGLVHAARNNRGHGNTKKFDLQCVICKTAFTSLSEMRYHVKNPCSKSNAKAKNIFPAEIKNVFPNTPPSTPPKLDCYGKIVEVKERTQPICSPHVSLSLFGVLSPPDLLQLPPQTGDSLSQTGATAKIQITSFDAYDETDGVDMSFDAVVPEEIVLPEDHLLKFEEVTISDLADIGILEYPEGINIVQLDGRIPSVHLVPLAMDGKTIGSAASANSGGIQSCNSKVSSGIESNTTKDPNQGKILSSRPSKRRSSAGKIHSLCTCCSPKTLKIVETSGNKGRIRQTKEVKQLVPTVDKVVKNEYNHTTTKSVSNYSKKKKRDPYVKKRRVKKNVNALTITVDKLTDKKIVGKKVCKPERPRKCLACGRVYKSLQLLQKHNRIPCRVKLTRNICAKVLRSRSSDKEKAPNGLQRQSSSGAKQGVKSTGKNGKSRKKKKIKNTPLFRGNPNLPQYKLVFSDLPEKEQFFFKLGMLAFEHVPLKAETPLNIINSETPKFGQLCTLACSNTPVLDVLTTKVAERAEDGIPVLTCGNTDISASCEEHSSPPVLELADRQPIHAGTLDDHGIESLDPPELDLIIPAANQQLLQFISRDTVSASPEFENKQDTVQIVEDVAEDLVSTYKKKVTKKAFRDPYSILHPMSKYGNCQGEKPQHEAVNGEPVSNGRRASHRSSKRLEEKALTKAADQQTPEQKPTKGTTDHSDGETATPENRKQVPCVLSGELNAESLSGGNITLHDGSSVTCILSETPPELLCEKTEAVTDDSSKSSYLPTRQLRRKNSSQIHIETTPATVAKDGASTTPSLKDTILLQNNRLKYLPTQLKNCHLTPSKSKLTVASPRKSLFESLQELSSGKPVTANSTITKCLSSVKGWNGDLIKNLNLTKTKLGKVLSPAKVSPRRRTQNGSDSLIVQNKPIVDPSQAYPSANTRNARPQDKFEEAQSSAEPRWNKRVNTLKELSSAKIGLRNRLTFGSPNPAIYDVNNRTVKPLKMLSSARIRPMTCARKRLFDESKEQDVKTSGKPFGANPVKISKVSPRKLVQESQSPSKTKSNKTVTSLKMLCSTKINPRKRLFVEAKNPADKDESVKTVSPLKVLSSAKVMRVSPRLRSIDTAMKTCVNKEHEQSHCRHCPLLSDSNCMSTIRVNDIKTSPNTGWTKISSKVPTSPPVHRTANSKHEAFNKRVSHYVSTPKHVKAHSNQCDKSPSLSNAGIDKIQGQKLPLLASRGLPPPLNCRALQFSGGPFKQDSPLKRRSRSPSTCRSGYVPSNVVGNRGQVLGKSLAMPDMVSGMRCNSAIHQTVPTCADRSTAVPVGSVSPGKTTLVLNLPSNVMLVSDGNSCSIGLQLNPGSNPPAHSPPTRKVFNTVPPAGRPCSNFNRRCNLMKKKNVKSSMAEPVKKISPSLTCMKAGQPLKQAVPQTVGLAPFMEEFPSSFKESAASTGPKVTVQYINQLVENTPEPSLMYTSCRLDPVPSGPETVAPVDMPNLYMFDDAGGLIVESEEIVEPGFSFDSIDPEFQSIQF